MTTLGYGVNPVQCPNFQTPNFCYMLNPISQNLPKIMPLGATDNLFFDGQNPKLTYNSELTLVAVRTSKILLITAVAVIFIIPSLNTQAYSTTSTSSFCASHSASQSCTFQSRFLNQHTNMTSSTVPPLGALPGIVPLMNSTTKNSAVSSDIPSISSSAYVGVFGYQTQGSDNPGLSSARTTVELFGSPNELGSSTVSGGLNAHVYDTDVAISIDYLLEFYVYYTSSGYANLAFAAYSACAGVPYQCGPAYGNCVLCPIKSVTIASGSWIGIASAGDPITISFGWNTHIDAYVFDYQDLNQNPYDWTVLDVYPSGTYSTMAPNGMRLGDANTWPLNPPDYYAYFFQMGFLISGSGYQNHNWELDLINTQYCVVSCTSNTYVNHATTMPIASNSGQIPGDYASYWKEIWAVYGTPAQTLDGVNINGFGTSTYNDLGVIWNGQFSCCGNVNLW